MISSAAPTQSSTFVYIYSLKSKTATLEAKVIPDAAGSWWRCKAYQWVQGRALVRVKKTRPPKAPWISHFIPPEIVRKNTLISQFLRMEVDYETLGEEGYNQTIKGLLLLNCS